MPAAAPAAAPADPARPRRLRALARGLARTIGLAAIAAALAAAGFAAGWLVFARPESPVLAALATIAEGGGAGSAAEPVGPGDAPEKMPAPVPDVEKFVTSYYSFADPLTSNLAESRRYLMVSVALSTQYDPAVMAHVETHKAALQSDMLAVIGTFTEEDLAGRAGRDRLGAALRDAINARLEALEGFGGVEGVYFPSFVMQ